MDWCVDTRVGGASELVESEVAAHITRHAIEPGVVELARAAVHQTLADSEPGALWLTLDWSSPQCLMRVRPVDRTVGTPVGPGVTRAHEDAAQLADVWGHSRQTSAQRTVELAVARAPEHDFDPHPADPQSLPQLDPGHLLGLVSAELGAGRPLDEAAARAGATAAAFLSAGPAAPPSDLADTARRLVETEGELGADFEIIEADRHRVVVRNGRCPFGPATSRGMCRFTSALAGGLAARASGRSDVTILESLAAGDHECRLVVDTGGQLDPKVSHRYQWPPSGDGAPPDDPPTGGRGFQVTLSLQLPRDKLSVPITRHLIRAAMDEVGVVSDDADAVELAVTEACANVIDHSGPGDAYDVAVSISPSACHIRVVDVGRGFDHHALSLSGMAGLDAEHGRGVALMHALVDQVRFESKPEKGTVVHLVKRLRFRDEAPAHKLMGERPGEPPST